MNPLLSTRRQFLAAFAALPFAVRSLAVRSLAQARPNGLQWVFLGTDKGAGIFRARWNPATGELGKPELAITTERPDYFAMHPSLPVMYSVNSLGGGKGAVSSFKVDAVNGNLHQLNRVSSHGDGPCFVSVDSTGSNAFVANYSSGSFAALKLGPQGELRDGGGAFDCTGNAACGPLGPEKKRQEAPHLHCATVSPSDYFVLACNLGGDAIEAFPITLDATPALGAPTRFPTRPGAGPRHLAFHPNGRWLYCIYELDCTIDMYEWHIIKNLPQLNFRFDSKISTLPKGVKLEGNTACEIIVGDDGRFVYASTRGVDEITVYRVDPTIGVLTLQQRVSCGGKTPRYMAFDPSRRWLLSCNQGDTGSVTVFAHDPATGKLSEKPMSTAADTPMCVQWV